jgi:hypothetical protein
MSHTYTLRNFTKIDNVFTKDAIEIFHNDTFFPCTSIKYIRYIRLKKDVSNIFIDTHNTHNLHYTHNIIVDNSINPTQINIDTNLNINQLASIVFSVNRNNKVYIYLKQFIKKINLNQFDYQTCINSSLMKIFAVHLAHIHSVIGDEENISSLIYQDCLFSEIVSQFETINNRKISKNDIPFLSSGMEIYSKIMYLSFLMVLDRVQMYQDIENEKYQKILKQCKLNVKKFNEVL